MKRGLSSEIQEQIIARRRLGYSMKETADNLGLSKGQVAGVLFRAGETKKRGNPPISGDLLQQKGKWK